MKACALGALVPMNASHVGFTLSRVRPRSALAPTSASYSLHETLGRVGGQAPREATQPSCVSRRGTVHAA